MIVATEPTSSAGGRVEGLQGGLRSVGLWVTSVHRLSLGAGFLAVEDATDPGGHTQPRGRIGLFDSGDDREAPRGRARRKPADAPLAVRMRPGPRRARRAGAVVGEGSALRAAIEAGHPHSAILYGPPGSGKTTLARIAAAGAEGAFEEESAVNAGRAEIRAVIERARERRGRGARRPSLHRRDPSLQQGPAGRPVAGGRGRDADPDRGDDREPLLRGQLGAAFAMPGLECGRWSRSRSRPSCAGRWPIPSAGSPTRRRSRTRPSRRWRSAAAGMLGWRSRRLERRESSRARGERRDRRRRHRGRLQRKAVDYDRAGDRHTTSSRPGSRRPAVPTSMPRSTTWR